MVIDVHVHIVLGPRSGPPKRAVAHVLELASRAGIDHLCLLGNVVRFGFYQTPDQVRIINDDTLDLVRTFPRQLSGMCFLNPQHEAAFIRAEIDRCVVAGPLTGIKLEADVNARSRRLDPIMRAAIELDVPVLHHSWYKTVGRCADESNASDIAHLARRFTKARIIMAHLGGVGIRGVLDVQACPYVFIDTSGAQPVADIVEYAVAKLGPERVLFGSDVCGRSFAGQIGKIHGARLTRRERRLILGENAARLLAIH